MSSSRKHPAVGMRARDLGELYTYLKLFGRVYTDCEAERQIIEHGIEEIFSRDIVVRMPPLPCRP